MEGKWSSLGYYYPGIAWRKYQRLKCGLDDHGLESWKKGNGFTFLYNFLLYLVPTQLPINGYQDLFPWGKAAGT